MKNENPIAEIAKLNVSTFTSFERGKSISRHRSRYVYTLQKVLFRLLIEKFNKVMVK